MLLNCDVGEDSWESLGLQGDQTQVNPKGYQSWIFTGRTGAEAETPILWPPDTKNWLIWKDPDAGKGWRWEEKGMTEDEMVGWHHRLNGHEFEQTPWDSIEWKSLVWYSPWGPRKSETEQQQQRGKITRVLWTRYQGRRRWGQQWPESDNIGLVLNHTYFKF